MRSSGTGSFLARLGTDSEFRLVSIKLFLVQVGGDCITGVPLHCMMQKNGNWDRLCFYSKQLRLAVTFVMDFRAHLVKALVPYFNWAKWPGLTGSFIISSRIIWEFGRCGPADVRHAFS